jgi:hypothetical protein
VAELGAEGRAAGDGGVALAADRGPNLAVDEQVEELVAQLEAEAGPAGLVEGAAVLLGAGRGLLEDPALAAVDGLLVRPGVDLLEDAGDRQQGGRLDHGHDLGQLGAVGVGDGGARFDAGELQDAGEHVREGEEQQHAGAVEEDAGYLGDDVADVGQEVPVGEHAALGAAGGAGGVDDRGEVVGPAGGAALLDVHVGVGAERVQGVERAFLGVDGPHVLDLRAEAFDHRGHLGVLDDDGDGAGVLEDELRLVGGGGLVDGDGDGAGGPDRVVQEGPLVAGGGHEGDPVAGLDPGRGQALRGGDDLGAELDGRDVLPGRALVEGPHEEDRGGVVLSRVPQRGEGVVFVGHSHHGGDGELAHGKAPFKTPCSRLCKVAHRSCYRWVNFLRKRDCEADHDAKGSLAEQGPYRRTPVAVCHPSRRPRMRAVIPSPSGTEQPISSPGHRAVKSSVARSVARHPTPQTVIRWRVQQ